MRAHGEREVRAHGEREVRAHGERERERECVGVYMHAWMCARSSTYRESVLRVSPGEQKLT